MGNKLINEITANAFNFQGEGEPNRDLLIKTYKNYKDAAALQFK